MNNTGRGQVVAIDGPAASGKTTIGRLLARNLGFFFLDTGCMYRAVTLAALQLDIAVNDEPAVTELARRIRIEVKPIDDERDDRLNTVLLDGRDVTRDLRLPAVDQHVSQISKYAGVRQEMVRRQRLLAQRDRVVMAGRDIGTVVLVDAPLKLYITATAEERARRRVQDRQNQGHQADFQTILADVVRRDQIDSTRVHSPMKAARDALIIDTTGKSIDELMKEILSLARLRLQLPVIDKPTAAGPHT